MQHQLNKAETKIWLNHTSYHPYLEGAAASEFLKRGPKHSHTSDTNRDSWKRPEFLWTTHSKIEFDLALLALDRFACLALIAPIKLLSVDITPALWNKMQTYLREWSRPEMLTRFWLWWQIHIWCQSRIKCSDTRNAAPQVARAVESAMLPWPIGVNNQKRGLTGCH